MTVVEARVPEPPAALTACAARPVPPDPSATAWVLARYLLQLDASGADCRRTLAELVAWLRAAKASAEGGIASP